MHASVIYQIFRFVACSNQGELQWVVLKNTANSLIMKSTIGDKADEVQCQIQYYWYDVFGAFAVKKSNVLE